MQENTKESIKAKTDAAFNFLNSPEGVAWLRNNEELLRTIDANELLRTKVAQFIVKNLREIDAPEKVGPVISTIADYCLFVGISTGLVYQTQPEQEVTNNDVPVNDLAEN